MGYVTPEEIRQAKQMDLLTYLQNYEPNELVRVAPNTYCTREHDSLKISNGKWCWFSRGIGGKTALDYLIKVQDYPFTQAVETILGRTAARPPVISYRQQIPEPHRDLMMPELNSNTKAVVKYLMGRGIHPEVIDYCLTHRLLFESRQYHNAVFVGIDKDKKIRHIHKRSTAAQGGFKGNAPGSEPEYSFHWHGGGDVLYLFEAPIDMLSFISMFKHCWKSQSYAASCGVSDKVLWQMLKDGPHIKKVYICFDNDEPGQQAAQRISREMTEKNIWHEIYPPENKDWNEDLLKWRKGQA